MANQNFIKLPPVPYKDLAADYNAILTQGSQFANEKDEFTTLNCHVESCIQIKRKSQRFHRPEWDDYILGNVSVTWYKDDTIVRNRPNGNPLIEGAGFTNDKHSLTLFWPKLSDQGEYMCTINYTLIPRNIHQHYNFYAGAAFEFIVTPISQQPPDTPPNITYPPNDQIITEGQNVTFTCKAMRTLTSHSTTWFRGPPPGSNTKQKTDFLNTIDHIREFKKDCQAELEPYVIENLDGDSFELSNVTEQDTGYYGCCVKNAHGIDIRTAEIKLINYQHQLEAPPASSDTNYLLPPAFAVFSLCMLFIFCKLISVLKTKVVSKNTSDTKTDKGKLYKANTEKYLDSSFYSIGKSMHESFYAHTSHTTGTTIPVYDHPPTTAPSMGTFKKNSCVINPTYGFLRAEFESNWVIPRRNLQRLEKIGEGKFGEVWRYIARLKDGSESFVAVKQLKNLPGLGDRERFGLIAEIEIMKLVNNHPNVIKLLNYCADREPILLVMEYAELGELRSYLRGCRANDLFGSTSITSRDLIRFSMQIAKGMEFISSQGIIHRDLAARNILVTKDKVCKIADFGFARRVNNGDAYELTFTHLVPIRWVAPEALVENRFTTKSDIYSLGILMWEVVTLGSTPYGDLSSLEVYNKVTAGERPERPIHCKVELYDLMAKCWAHDSTGRPSFKETANQLEELLLSDNDYIEIDRCPKHTYYNL